MAIYPMSQTLNRDIAFYSAQSEGAVENKMKVSTYNIS